MTAIRIVLADDHATVRTSFRRILDSTGDMEVVAAVATGAEALAAAVELRPDVCVVDVRMPEMDGIEVTRQLLAAGLDPPPRIVIATTFDLDEYVEGALDAGATGFLLKTAGPELLIEAVRAAVDGHSLISPAVAARLVQAHYRPATPADRGLLSEREEEVVAAVATGLTNAEIAQDLNLSRSTVKAHVASSLDKLGLRNRVELAVWAHRNGLG